ncbi:SDR family oxidoreductase [Microbispora sp. RL4-1S]|uniref:SDR family oxidoreductase n=1 Tax=Microbispora oryzae TaxID=2806554 RepID=A0A940WK23_9ACTN|nr:SDR family oxidoreductase [Microbispora oryzae]MBP2707134.1 SDR family oxidoreductase [Microbispora oryzae]
MSLDGRTALVTGAGSGIGRACARRLAAEGAHVVVADVNAAAAEKVAAEIGGTPVVVDLSDPEFVTVLRDRLPTSPDSRLTAGVTGGITGGITGATTADITADIVVNNAGFQHVAPIEDFPPKIFAKILRVMVEAPFLLARAVLPGMYERRWGRIVNISSVHGLRASPYKSAYVTAKHGLEGLSKVIALEGAAHGVTSNCVNPAYVRTPLVENQIADQARTHGIGPDEVVEQIMLAPAAIKRLIEPDEVAEMVAYLCGPQGSFVTGASIPIDGGWSAR